MPERVRCEAQIQLQRCSLCFLRCLLFSSQKATKITKKKGIEPGDPFRSQLNVLVRSEESFAPSDCERNAPRQRAFPIDICIYLMEIARLRRLKGCPFHFTDSIFPTRTMPITGPLSLNSISQEEFAQLDYRVMRHAFECQNQLGRLCEELIHQNDLAARLQAAGPSALKEVSVTVTNRNFAKTYSLILSRLSRFGGRQRSQKSEKWGRKSDLIIT